MTVKKFSESRIFVVVDFIIVAALTTGVLIPIDTPLHFLLSTYAVEFMSLFLSIGFIAFFMRNNSIILINFLACIALCTFLKESEIQELAQINTTDTTEIRVAHLVLDDVESIGRLERDFQDLDADFLSIQTPIKPTLEQQLIKDLSKRLPYWEKTTCNNNLTMFVFSAYELRDLDTLYDRYNNTVSLVGTMFVDGLETGLSFLSMNVPVGENIQEQNKKQLARLSSHINNNCKNRPLLTLSGAQLASWSPEIQAFRTAHKMSDSHNDNKASSRNEHIFYSKDLMCTEFSEIFNGDGVVASYKFKKQNAPITETYSTTSFGRTL